MAAEKPKPPAPVGAPQPAEAPRVAARLAQLDGEVSRARIAADSATGIAVRARLRELRTVDAVQLPTNLEAELAKMTDLGAFERRIGDLMAGRALAAPGGTRARGALAPVGGHGATPAPTDTPAPPITAEQLRAEGADDAFVQLYETVSKDDPSGAAGLLVGFRKPEAVAMRARLAGKGPTGRALSRPS